MSRGKVKQTVRDLSRHTPTPEEALALTRAFSTATEPIVTAILGVSMIERELDILLRSRFRGCDDSMWARLCSDIGPFGTFAAKIVAGHAFGFYDDTVRKALVTVKDIRNAFAHAKKLIKFDDELVVSELRGLSLPANPKSGTFKTLNAISKMPNGPQAAYINLCSGLAGALLRRHLRAINAKSRHHKRQTEKIRPRLQRSPFFKPLAEIYSQLGGHRRPSQQEWLVGPSRFLPDYGSTHQGPLSLGQPPLDLLTIVQSKQGKKD